MSTFGCLSCFPGACNNLSFVVLSRCGSVEAGVGVDLGLDSVDSLEQLLEHCIAVLGKSSFNLYTLLFSLDLDTV